MSKMTNNETLYKDARDQHRHLSYIIYFTLTFFITITGGWFYIVLNHFSSVNIPNFSKLIGCLFIILVLIQSKVSRTSYDNNEGENDFREKIGGENFSISGIKAINDFLMYLVLTFLAVFIYTYKDPKLLPMFNEYFLGLFFLVYYVMAHGKFLIYQIKEGIIWVYLKIIKGRMYFNKEQIKDIKKNINGWSELVFLFAGFFSVSWVIFRVIFFILMVLFFIVYIFAKFMQNNGFKGKDEKPSPSFKNISLVLQYVALGLIVYFFLYPPIFKEKKFLKIIKDTKSGVVISVDKLKIDEGNLRLDLKWDKGN